MKKRIILGLPAVYGIGELLRENLQYLGYEVIDLSFDYKAFSYKSGYQRAVNFLRKTFLGDKSYKDRLRFAVHRQQILDKLAGMQFPADYALIIRPETYSTEVLESIKNKAKTLVGYQWDGMSRFPWVEKLIPFFDRFFVFDPADRLGGDDSRKYLGNFFFTLPRLYETPVTQKGGAYYVGGFSRARLRILSELQPALQAAGVLSDFSLHSRKPRNLHIAVPGLKVSKEICTYEKNLEQAKKAKVLIDITAACHQGLSLRFFESICYQKKLITTNPSVVRHDFYHRDNIFIYGMDDIRDLPAFLARPYQEQSPDLTRKYAFDNWIRYALDIPPYQSTDMLPAERPAETGRLMQTPIHR